MRAQLGFSLLEVLVAGVVTALGLSGIAALLLTSTAGTSAAHLDSRAALLARNLAAAMALSPGAGATFLANPPETTADCTQGSTCSPAQFAAFNHKQWHIAVASLLPGGSGLVCQDTSPADGSPIEPGCDGMGPLAVKIFWVQPGNGTQAQRLSMVVPQ